MSKIVATRMPRTLLCKCTMRRDADGNDDDDDDDDDDSMVARVVVVSRTLL
jgi:hypothetical protein